MDCLLLYKKLTVRFAMFSTPKNNIITSKIRVRLTYLKCNMKNKIFTQHSKSYIF